MFGTKNLKYRISKLERCCETLCGDDSMFPSMYSGKLNELREDLRNWDKIVKDEAMSKLDLYMFDMNCLAQKFDALLDHLGVKVENLRDKPYRVVKK